MNTLGEHVREAREKARLTQAELAEKAGISRSYLAAVEGNKYNPSLKTLMAIAKVCKVDLNFLAGMLEIPTKRTGHD